MIGQLSIDTESFLKDQYIFSKMNGMIKNTLSTLAEFINLPHEMKIYSKFFTISKLLRNLKEYMIFALTRIDSKGDHDQINNDHTIKLVKLVYSYNLNVNRYISESLLNTDLTNIPPLDIDQLGEYLQFSLFN